MSKNIYFFGDSICFGQYVSVEKTFVHRIAKYINSKVGNDYCFMNPSIINNTTQDALQRLHHDVLFRNPDYVYIQFGLNDCNVWADRKEQPRVSKELFRNNLTEIVNLCKVFGAKVLIGNNHPTNKNPVYDDLAAYYNALILNVANKNGIAMVHNYSACENYREYNEHLLPDGIHLSEIGHELYAYNISEELIKILE